MAKDPIIIANRSKGFAFRHFLRGISLIGRFYCHYCAGMKIAKIFHKEDALTMGTVEFNKMLENNSEFLRPFAATLTRDSEVAKDLFQDTLYRALVNREKYNVGTNIKAWLYTIMRNIFINNYRRRAQQKTISVPYFYDYMPEVSLGHSASSESILEAKEIMHTIHRLPVIYKTPFHLYFEGFRYQEIANILREPLGTIKSRIHFARKMLKEQLANY